MILIQTTRIKGSQPRCTRQLLQGFVHDANNCGSGLARECGVPVDISVSDTPLSRASPLPHVVTRYARLLLTTSYTSLDNCPEARIRSSSAFINA
ncbi:hypothetical protein C3E97_003195 [Pseudomonas sp. MWU12-2115]|nr:hypothetical protein C3E97_003195 [Pseudomonas sp. MWU12-2115]